MVKRKNNIYYHLTVDNPIFEMTSEKPRVLAIDPGLSGGYSYFDFDFKSGIIQRLQWSKDNPSKLITKFPEHDIAVIELVHAQPKWGSKASFNFGMSFGQIIHACQPYLGFVFIGSQRWKRHMGLFGEPKSASISLARTYGCPPEVEDHNLAESYLIGSYFIHHMKGQTGKDI